MNERVLVTYASMSGSTAGVAERIGEVIRQRGAAADVLPVNKVTDISPYTAVIVGSPARAGKLLPRAVAFVREHQAALQGKRLSVFVACMAMARGGPDCETTASAYLESVRALVKPAAEGLFAGAYDPSKVNVMARAVMKMLKSPVGDFRNWEHIAAWANSVPLA